MSLRCEDYKAAYEAARLMADATRCDVAIRKVKECQPQRLRLCAGGGCAAGFAVVRVGRGVEMSDKIYKWASPFDWLSDRAETMDHEALLSNLLAVAINLDSDQLQDIFQSEMDEDGYFSPLCEECQEPIDPSEETSNYCYSHTETCSKHPDRIEAALLESEEEGLR